MDVGGSRVRIAYSYEFKENLLQSNLAKLKSKVSHYEEENMLLQSEIKKLESQVSTE